MQVKQRGATRAPETLNDGHRARLRARFLESGGSALADYELLELLLMFAIPRRDVKPLAKRLLKHFGNLHDVLNAPPEDLETMEGLGVGTVVLLRLVHKLALDTRREKMRDAPMLGNRLDLMDYLYTRFAGHTREEFVVLFLDAQLKLLHEETLFTGTLTEVTASPREILKRALALNAAGLVVAHNHPSGMPQPSAQDKFFTNQLVLAMQCMHLTLHDHVIVGTEGCYSFKGAGEL